MQRIRVRGQRVCIQGQLQELCTPGTPQAEVCDGRDNDCDGVNDEGLDCVCDPATFVEQDTQCGVGACRRDGRLTCEHFLPKDSCQPGAPQVDSDTTCDGIDDNCNGQIDEEFVAQPITCGQGACAVQGQRVCVQGQEQVICTPVAAQAEVCDGLDNDCDGTTDEELGTQTCGVGECRRTAPVCTDGQPVTCTPGDPTAEICGNGKDDDCDGRTDVGPDCICDPLIFVEQDTQCGIGACRREGRLTCEQFQPRDNCQPGAPLAANDVTCDGIDDDCDGRTDEEFVAQPNTCGQGACAVQGQRVCVQGQLQEICTPLAPRAEVCDGQDNDCDGAIDEELLPPPTFLTQGVCEGAVKLCGGVDGWQEPRYAELQGYEGIEISCDGRDNDCDGETDNGVVGCVRCLEGSSAPCNGCPVGTAVPAGWVCVPAGTYTLGSPEDQAGHEDDEVLHEVQLTRPFLLRATEVTQTEWLAVMGSNPSWFSASGGGGCNEDPCDNRPVEMVAWHEAIAYCNARSQAEGLERCYQNESGEDYNAADAAASMPPTWPRGLACAGYRLPTEAEWETAARAGSLTATPGGNLDEAHPSCQQPNPVLDEIAWFCGNSGWRTHPVATKTGNAWGAFDLLGNVYEWCWDRYAAYPVEPLLDPLGPVAGSFRVLRGGSYGGNAWFARSAFRHPVGPAAHDNLVGFRPTRSLTP